MTSLREVDLCLILLRQLTINRNQLYTFSDRNHFSFHGGKTLRKKEEQSSNHWKYQKMINVWLWREVSYCLAEIDFAWLRLWLIFRFHVECYCECEYLWNRFGRADVLANVWMCHKKRMIIIKPTYNQYNIFFFHTYYSKTLHEIAFRKNWQLHL